ncbi:hypothetical protein [Falsirhodobacter deserti]|uniref:hypothetical protein n=1 Tax=Falsirhodobacter deserti TaxID=1365611 RepID=UPI0013E3B0F0|nr:hypothetical protein [Falsirhodobacter deserti]
MRGDLRVGVAAAEVFSASCTKPDDPVVAAIGDFDALSEQYSMHVALDVEVLAAILR